MESRKFRARSGFYFPRWGFHGFDRAQQCVQTLTFTTFPQEGSTAPGAPSSAAAPAAAPSGGAAVDAAVASISKYKVGGDGLKCLKLLELFLKNVEEKPGEDKYRSINTESNAFKTKVTGQIDQWQSHPRLVWPSLA